MKRLILLGLMSTLAACGLDAGEPFRQGLPTSSTVALKVPYNSKALTSEGTRQDPLEGQISDFYQLTRGVSLVVNGGTAAVLDLMGRVVKNPPTSISGNTAVWGPHTDALSPNTYRVTVTRTSTDVYSWEIAARSKTDPDTAFKNIVFGTHTRTGVDLGSGTFTIDWDTAAQLPEHDANVGKADVTYSRISTTANTTVDAVFTNVKDGADATKRVNAKYAFVSVPNMGGSFDFQLNKDMITGPAIETAAIRSRWLQTGAGRADVKVSGGDLASPATINDCWDSGFLSRVMVNSFAASQNYGATSACAFTTAEYSQL